MRINPISADEYTFLKSVFNDYPNLHGQNLRGYATLNEDTFTDADKQILKEIDTLLRKTVIGFSSFTYFRRTTGNNPGRAEIKLQYDWSLDSGSVGYNPTFIGVGYVEIDELYFGFKTED